MKILLDTHILIWILQDDERLPSKARNILTNSETELFYSSASIWEAQIKHIKKSEEFSSAKQKAKICIS